MAATEIKGAITEVVVNSADRIAGSASSTSFVVTLPYAINNVVGARLEEVIIPKSIFNVTTGVNDSLDFSDSTVPGGGTCVFPGGFYASDAIVSTLTGLLNGISSGYSCSINATTGFLTISNSGTFTLLGSTGTNFAKTIGTLLGFPTTSVTSSGGGATGVNCINLLTPLSVLINILELRGNSVTTAGAAGWAWKVSLAANISGQVVQWTSGSEYTANLRVSTTTLTRLTITLTDRAGKLINLQGLDWEFQFQCIQCL